MKDLAQNQISLSFQFWKMRPLSGRKGESKVKIGKTLPKLQSSVPTPFLGSVRVDWAGSVWPDIWSSGLVSGLISFGRFDSLGPRP